MFVLVAFQNIHPNCPVSHQTKSEYSFCHATFQFETYVYNDYLVHRITLCGIVLEYKVPLLYIGSSFLITSESIIFFAVCSIGIYTGTDEKGSTVVVTSEQQS